MQCRACGAQIETTTVGYLFKNIVDIYSCLTVWEGEFLQFERISHVPRETRIAFAIVANSLENVGVCYDINF